MNPEHLFRQLVEVEAMAAMPQRVGQAVLLASRSR